MKTKNNLKTQNTINLLLVLTALSVLVIGCSSVNNTPPNNVAPSPTQASSPTQAASTTPTPKNPAEAFYGDWETKDNASGNFVTTRFSTATQKGDEYVGTITEVGTGQDVFTYTVKPNNNITLLPLPGVPGAGISHTYEYEVSGDGNTLTIKSNPPDVFRKGTSNSQIQKDATTLATGAWRSASDQTRMLALTNAKQFDKGWNGNYLITVNGAPDEQGTFAITNAGKITLTPDSSGGSTEFSYKIKSNKFFDLTKTSDGSTDTWIQ